MQVGKVVGRAISTVKHKSFQGVKLLLVQALDGKGQPGGTVRRLVGEHRVAVGVGVLVDLRGGGQGDQQQNVEKGATHEIDRD